MSVRVGRTAAVALWGLTGTPIHIEASINDGLPGIDIVGLPDASVTESRKRIRAAIANLGITLSAQRITVNLSPGGVKKIGTGFDLGIATAILAAEGHVPASGTRGVVHIGELGLDGRLHPIHGVMPAVLAAAKVGFSRCIVPHGNAGEAFLVSGINVVAAGNLAEAINALGGSVTVPALPPVAHAATQPPPPHQVTDLREVRGQADARHALEVAAAGGHHLLMVGSPGAGKTLLAGCLPGILPQLDETEAVEALALRSIDGTFTSANKASLVPPFQTPHHRTSASAMVGGSRPGAIGVFSRAHRGVLFMDEAPEFHRDVLEALRQPLESGRCDINRAWGSVTLPARFQLVLAANPCPCGLAMSPHGGCMCTPLDKRRYRGRLSGPLLDRVDIQLDMLPVTPADIHTTEAGEPSSAVAARVTQARERQRRRYSDLPWTLNSQAPGAWLRDHAALSPAATAPLDRALERGALTMRGYDRIVRVATTLADLEERDAPTRDDLMAALLLRTREAA